MRTYVLLGDDMEHMEPAVQARNDIIVIRASSGISVKDAAKSIEPPANVILLAHGGLDGTFTWSSNQTHSYEELFKALPRSGIGAFLLNSCYGANAIYDSHYAPPGMYVFPMTAENTLGWGDMSSKVVMTTAAKTQPIDLYLNILNAYSPTNFLKHTNAFNIREGSNAIADPKAALPSTFAIAGTPPMLIHLESYVDRFHRTFSSTPVEVWNAAIEDVKKSFDDDPELIDSVALITRIGDFSVLDHLSDTQVAHVNRISSALMVAFMEQRGHMAELRQATAAHQPTYDETIELTRMNDPDPSENNQTPVFAKELEGFADLLGAQVTRDGYLTAAEIKSMQRKLNVKDDGLIGMNTIEAIQEKRSSIEYEQVAAGYLGLKITLDGTLTSNEILQIQKKLGVPETGEMRGVFTNDKTRNAIYELEEKVNFQLSETLPQKPLPNSKVQR